MPGQALLGYCFRSRSITPASRPCCGRGPGLPCPAGSAGTREAPGGPGKPGCCGALMKKVTGGWGSKGVGHLDRLSWRGQIPIWMGAAGERPAPLPRCLRTRCFVGAAKGEPGPRGVALTGRFVCSQKSAQEGSVLLFPSRNVTNWHRAEIGLEVIPSLCTFRK